MAAGCTFTCLSVTHPDWNLQIHRKGDESTSPPTEHARAKGGVHCRTVRCAAFIAPFGDAPPARPGRGRPVGQCACAPLRGRSAQARASSAGAVSPSRAAVRRAWLQPDAPSGRARVVHPAMCRRPALSQRPRRRHLLPCAAPPRAGRKNTRITGACPANRALRAGGALLGSRRQQACNTSPDERRRAHAHWILAIIDFFPQRRAASCDEWKRSTRPGPATMLPRSATFPQP